MLSSGWFLLFSIRLMPECTPCLLYTSNWIKRLLHHIGFVAWTGCGFMGPTMGKIEGVLPNYGVGPVSYTHLVSPSTVCPKPKMLSPDTQTASPDIFVG